MVASSITDCRGVVYESSPEQSRFIINSELTLDFEIAANRITQVITPLTHGYTYTYTNSNLPSSVIGPDWVLSNLRYNTEGLLERFDSAYQDGSFTLNVSNVNHDYYVGGDLLSLNQMGWPVAFEADGFEYHLTYASGLPICPEITPAAFWIRYKYLIGIGVLLLLLVILYLLYR